MRKKIRTSIVCQQKLNGNMLPEQKQPPGILLGMMYQTWVIMHGILITQEGRSILWVRSNQIPGPSMICMVLCGNECRMNGMAAMKALLVMVVHGKMEMAPSRWFVEAAGTTMPRIVSQPFATTTTLATVLFQNNQIQKLKNFYNNFIVK